MATSWDLLTAIWREAGLSLRPGAGQPAIRKFEAQYSVTLPTDLREYFLTVDGMEDEFDPGMNRFWPLALVKPVHEELTDICPDRWSYPDCYLFADHCIWCLAWAVHLDKEPLQISGPVFQVTCDKVRGRMIASSFTDFVEMYLEDNYSVL